MKDTYHLLDVGICSIGLTYGLENVETTLGVVLLTINILQLIIKACVKIYELYITKASPEEVISALGSAEDKVEEMLDQITIEEVDKK